jgi:hypothetical protein
MSFSSYCGSNGFPEFHFPSAVHSGITSGSSFSFGERAMKKICGFWHRLGGASGQRVLGLSLIAMVIAPSVASADLFVVDNGFVDRFDSSTGAVIPTNGQSYFASLPGATGVTVAPDGLVYAGTSDPGSDPHLAVVNRYNASTGQQIGGAFIPYANDASQLSNVQGLAFGPDENLYAADLGDNGPVKVFNSAGGYVTQYLTTGGNAQAVAFDPALPNDLFVATGSTIESFNLTTHVDTIVVQGSSDTFSNGADLAFGPDGKLYVLDISGGTPQVLRYNADGTGQSVFTNFSSFSILSGAFEPADMAFGPDGSLYVSGQDLSSGNPNQGDILKLSADGSSASVIVSGLQLPGFLAFNSVPEPVGMPIVAAGVMMMWRRNRGRRLN